jgi:hypothetical protein
VAAAKARRTSPQERFERTVAGRVLISAFLVLTLLTVLAANLPDSRLKSLLNSAVHTYLYGVGLDQSWTVFAPEPRRETIHVTATVTYEDGSKATWSVPKWDPVIGAYADYRWLKWAEYVILPEQSVNLAQPAALYVAREKASSTRRPTRVELQNRWYALEPPGDADKPKFIREGTFFTTQITEEMLREDDG